MQLHAVIVYNSCPIPAHACNMCESARVSPFVPSSKNLWKCHKHSSVHAQRRLNDLNASCFKCQLLLKWKCCMTEIDVCDIDILKVGWEQRAVKTQWSIVGTAVVRHMHVVYWQSHNIAYMYMLAIAITVHDVTVYCAEKRWHSYWTSWQHNTWEDRCQKGFHQRRWSEYAWKLVS